MKIQQNLRMTFQYSIHFTRDLFSDWNCILSDVLQGKDTRGAVFLDNGVAKAWPELESRIPRWLHAHKSIRQAGPVVKIPGGEACKNDLGLCCSLVSHVKQLGLDRHSYCIVIGGGAVLDLVGFVASVCHRGIRYIRIPTTVLSQGDSGVGVKNGINFQDTKNFLGAFAPPAAVINDLDFLRTLSDRDWIAGVSEAFKVAIIRDPTFMEFLIQKSNALRLRNEGAMEELVRTSAALHAAHIQNGGDPFELGAARPLDFGHWIAHWLESVTGYELNHGEAVAIGIALDLGIAHMRGLVTQTDQRRIIQALTDCGLPVWHKALQWKDRRGQLRLTSGLEEFRQHLGGELTLIMPDGLGQSCQIHNLEEQEIMRAVCELELFDERSTHAAFQQQSPDVLSKHSSGREPVPGNPGHMDVFHGRKESCLPE